MSNLPESPQNEVSEDEGSKTPEVVAERSKGFLDYLKESSPNYPEYATYEDENADTLRTGNVEHHQRGSSTISDLFDPPTGPKQADTVSSPTSSKNTHATSLEPRTSLSPKPKAGHSRNRTVSFDQNTFKQKTQGYSAADQMHGGTPGNIEPLPLLRENSTKASSSRHRKLSSDKTLTIDDLIAAGPYELEAETHLLKVIEEHQHHQQRSHQRYRSESSSLLSSVPDGLVHNFCINEEDEKPGDGSTLSNNDSYPAPKESFSDDKQSTGSSSTRRSLLKKQKSHRRLISVEDRLAGLTAAMKVFDRVDDGSNTGTAMNPGMMNASAAEQLGYNAVQILGDDLDGLARTPNREHRAQSQDFLEPVTEGDERDVTGVSNSDGSEDIEAQQPGNGGGESESNQFGSSRRNDGKPGRGKSRVFTGAADRFKEDWDIWQSFFIPRRENVLSYMRTVTCYIMIPFIGVAAILFYLGSNPPTGKGEEANSTNASASWWLLFCVRQVVTFSMALSLQMLVIDFLCIGTRVVLRFLGPLLTLLLVQSKGWPFVVFCWSLINFCTLHGKYAFASHWGYWQDYVGLFNEENPSGEVVDSLWNQRVLTIGVTVSVVVALKRFIIGIYLGRQTFGHYGEQLAKVMNKLVLISEVAQLARRAERVSKGHSFDQRMKTIQLDKESFYGMAGPVFSDEDETSAASTLKTVGTEKVIDPNNTYPLTGSLKESEKRKIATLLDRWEEPDRQSGHNDQISVSSVLRFRNALSLIRNDYPFSYAFGPADSRVACIESSQDVYRRLLAINPEERQYLHFDSIALVALEHGEIDQQKAKDLIRIFRPDREGGLTLVDFVKSTDAVYKEFRLLQASIENSSQIDRAFENIVNILFYTILVTIIMSQLGLVILAFAFMIGSASSKYFEGLLFILVRRPYGIGDMIHVSNVEQDTLIEVGSPCWIVQHVTLFETIVTWLPTMERASLSNGSLASSRIINWARSPNARFNITLTFPIETRYETIEVFKRAIEEYLKIRPREWLALNGFRVNRIATDKGFMQVILTVQHRENWQNIGQCLDSRANMISYCQEVQKQLGMHYKAPPVPIDFRNFNRGILEGMPENSSVDTSQKEEFNEAAQEAQVQQFRNSARTKHNIFV